MPMSPIVQDMVGRIARRFHPVRIILFGSNARGTADRLSDVDLLVVLVDVKDKHQLAVEMRRALADLPVGKDFLLATPDEVQHRGHIVGTALRSALLEGEVVYDAAA